MLVTSAAICMECTAPPVDAFITCSVCEKSKPRHCYSRVNVIEIYTLVLNTDDGKNLASTTTLWASWCTMSTMHSKVSRRTCVAGFRLHRFVWWRMSDDGMPWDTHTDHTLLDIEMGCTHSCIIIKCMIHTKKRPFIPFFVYVDIIVTLNKSDEIKWIVDPHLILRNCCPCIGLNMHAHLHFRSPTKIEVQIHSVKGKEKYVLQVHLQKEQCAWVH